MAGAPPIKRLRLLGRFVAAALAAGMLPACVAHAANPRWTTGWPYFSNDNGAPVVWYTTQPQYFTDPGDLSATVNHAAADALVASAASVWNTSMSSIVLGQGGPLNEHVSSANVYVGSTGPVFPSDVQATNSLAKPIAIIYDTDGSVTDTLLGGGASDPGNCRQSAVTESVDSISTNGQIQHALIVLNGRCISSVAATQQEMKYRLVRAFGRVLGLGWSQLNDNVFTGVPQPTLMQAQSWPVMHPIDVLCGPYAYQCMVNPFTLRTDDLSALISMYPVTTSGGGKTASYANAAQAIGFISFANSQGMEGVLVSLRRFHFGPGYWDACDLVSAVSGAQFEQNAGNPDTPKGSSLANSMGSLNPYYEGYYSIGWVPVPTTDYFDDFMVTTSTINPLYTGQYSVGPYAVSQVTPSGPPMTGTQNTVSVPYGSIINLTANGSSTSSAAAAPAACSANSDGTEGSPNAMASSGLWSDALCGYQHAAWSSLAVKAGRSLTMEVTAVDEQGYATTGKMLPVLGVWDSTDNMGTLPTLASQAVGLNASTLGMTNLIVSTSAARTLRVAVADQRGDGRPDYAYNARVLYADSVSPASLPANGGAVTISGMGFRAGNTVTVNGIAANVTGWTPTTITLVAPAITGPLAADVVVSDLSTGGQTIMSGALSYSQNAQPDVLSVVSKPADGGYVGSVGSPVFKVQAMLPDGVTQATGVSVTFSSAKATFGACSGASTCMLTTDGSGFVSSAVTPTASGTVTLGAAAGAASVTTSFVALAIPVDGLSVLSLPSGTVYVTLPATAPFRVKVTLPDGTTPGAGVSVVVTATNATLGGCSGAATCTMIANSSGVISTTVTPLAVGVVSLLASAGGGMVSASFGATALPADMLHLVSKPADGSYVGRAAAVPLAVQVMLGDNATPASGASVTMTATGATLGACGSASCVLTADALGSVSTSVTLTTAGTVTVNVAAGGGTLSASFTAAVVPPDVLTVVSKPANGSYVGRVAAIPFVVQTALGDTGAAAAGVSVTLSASGATLGCGASPCTLVADASGSVSTTVTPTLAGTVTLSGSAGGGTVSTTFTAVNVPPDVLTVGSKPADGSYVGRVAAIPFVVQTALGDTGAAAAGVGVTLSASGATLGCGASPCTLIADASGGVSTTVTPTLAGTVTLSGSAGGGTVSTTFTAAVVPPDSLTIVSKPAGGSYVGRVAATALAVQVMLGDGSGLAVGVSVVLSATNATLGACGAASCTLTADATGTVATQVTSTAVGLVTLTANAGGGTVSTTFNTVAVPPDVLHVVTKPVDGSYVGRTATLPLSVSVAFGDTGLPATGVAVSVSATNATLACGASTCALTADATGTILITVTPSVVGTVSLTAAAGGGTIATTFTAAAVPPDVLHVVTKPASGSYVGRTAALSFAVQTALGDTGAAAAGVAVTVSALNATLAACAASSCVLMADATGSISTAVTPTATGTVTLTASAGGGTISASFNAVAVPPDTVQVVTQPANGTYVGSPATTAFSVLVLLGDTGAPASGVNVTVTASNATLGCGASTCTLVANAAGNVSTPVTPAAPGMVTLTATAGGGTASTSFSAVNVPPDILRVVSAPADNTYLGTPAALPFSVLVLLGDGVTPASGVSVVVTATGATLGACGIATCTMTATALGTISTTVTATAAGNVGLTTSAGGGSLSASFVAINSPDIVQVLSVPSDSSFTNRVAATPFAVQVSLNVVANSRGIHALAVGRTPAVGVLVTLTAVGATLGACGLPACVLTTDSTGTVSTTVTPILPGAVTLLAASGGGTANSSFMAAVPPDVVRVTSTPANGSYANRTTSAPFAAQVVLGDGTTPAAGAAVTLTASGATLNTCGLATCVVAADSAGMVSTLVTPTSVGTVTLTATAGGGTATSSFTSAAIPPDALHVVAQPANGAYTGRTASAAFTVQALLGDTGGPAVGASVTISAINATFASCGLATCVLTADANGSVSSAVTPTSAGTVALNASAGGGSVSASFTSAAVPPDSLHVITQPASGSYAQRTATLPFTVQVLLGDTGGAASGVSITVSAVNATLGACGLSTCVLTADSTGTVSTNVSPTAIGTVILSGSSGGGNVTSSFTSVAVPPASLHVLSQPANGSYLQRAAAAPFTVQTLLGDTGGAANGAAVTVSAVNATLASCGASICVLTADASGNISTAITPLAVALVTLTAAASGGSVTATFTAASVPPDALHILTQPADGSYVTRVAAIPLKVQTLLGDTGAPASGVSVTLGAAGATLGACGSSTCVLTADSNGNVSTTVTPTVTGPVQLTATAGGGTSTITFTSAAIPPDALQVVSEPVNGAYVNVTASTPYTVQVLLGDTGAPAIGVHVTVTATNAVLGACGQATCVMTADSSGSISTTVTPTAVGPIDITATAGGGSITVVFNAAAQPPDVLHVVSQPSGSVYAGLGASSPFSVQVLLADGTTPAAGISVILSSTNAALGVCAGGSSCALTTNGAGMISTAVTPQQPGSVLLHASAGGGSVSATLTALALPPDLLSVATSPASPAYLGTAAPVRFAVHILLGDGSTVAAGAAVTLTSSGASFGACASAPCILTADASGNISTPVTPLGAGTITLTASAGGGTVSTSFNAVADVLRVLTAPANGSYTGSVTTLPFAVQVLLGDATTPAPGAAVALTAVNATLGACATMPCTLIADSQGTISTTVIASVAGTITLSAASAGGTATATFTATAPPDILEVQSAPANGSYVGRSAPTTFALRVALGDAINRLSSGTGNVLPPAVGVNVTLTATGATLDACGLPTCSLTTDAMGLVSTTVTPTGIGAVGLFASAGGGTVSASFTAAAAPDVLRVVSVPANGSYSGRVASSPFAIHIFSADGTTPAAGTAVLLTASGGTLGACGLAICTVTADASGQVSTTVTPAAPGAISLSATGGGSSVFASFTAATAPDTLQLVSAPANGAYTGRVASSPFSVRVLLGDGVTPAAGFSVQLATSNATLGACGLSNCSVTSDANGVASSAVTPISAGSVTLTASAGGGTVAASFTAVDPVRTITISRTTEYVAAGATVSWNPTVTVFENGTPISGVSVVWTASAPALAFSAQNSTSDASGSATVIATVGPLASGDSTSGQACAWTNLCASFGAQASDAALWRLAVVSGDAQTVGANDTLQPLVVSALDQAGDSLAGVTIEVHQTVRGWVTCPSIGRCPTGPVLDTASSTVVSDSNGQAVINPDQLSGSAEMTQIVAAAGTYGYVSVSLAKTP